MIKKISRYRTEIRETWCNHAIQRCGRNSNSQMRQTRHFCKITFKSRYENCLESRYLKNHCSKCHSRKDFSHLNRSDKRTFHRNYFESRVIDKISCIFHEFLPFSFHDDAPSCCITLSILINQSSNKEFASDV